MWHSAQDEYISRSLRQCDSVWQSDRRAHVFLISDILPDTGANVVEEYSLKQCLSRGDFTEPM